MFSQFFNLAAVDILSYLVEISSILGSQKPKLGGNLHLCHPRHHEEDMKVPR
ncbi:Hypothetical protein FKW44_011850, partial [Caligus rogercresseyi]